MLARVSIKAVGGSGRIAVVVVIDNMELNVLVPMLLMAATSKLYVVPAVNPVLIKEVVLYEAISCIQLLFP